MSRSALPLAVLLVVSTVLLGALASCSVVNAPDEPMSTVEAGGTGGTGGTPTGTGATGGTGGTPTGTGATGGTGGGGPAVCGDGVTEGSEECDDNNTNDGDGCDGTCNVEGSCAAPVPIPLTDSGQGELTGSMAAANIGGPDQVGQALCDGASVGAGWDRIYRIDLSEPRDLLLELSGDFDMILRLLGAPCDVGTAIAEPGGDGCVNAGSVGITETLRVPDLAAGAYYVVVDGVDAAAEGDFTLDVTARCPSSSLRLTKLDIGSNDGLQLVNTSTACSVHVEGLGVLFDDSSGQDRAVVLPDQWVAEGATLRVAENPPPGHVSSGSFDFTAARGGAAMLCFGPCSLASGANVIDLVAFSEGQVHPPLPAGLSFSPAGLSGITNESTYSYIREAMAGSNPAFVAADWAVGFRDGFEDGDASDLVVQSGSYTRQVTNTQAALGQYSYTMTGGNVNHSDGSTIQLSFGQPSYISYRVRFDSSTGNARGYFVFRSASDSNGIIFVYCNNSSFTIADVGGIGSCSPNTWYHVEFRNLNWGTRTYDVYVDSSLVIAGAAFRGAGTQGDRIDLYHFTGPSQAWWDEIIVKP